MKRVVLLLAALALLCPAALGEVFWINDDGTDELPGFALLLTEDGTPLTPVGAYASIYPLTPEDTPEDQRRYQAEPAELAVHLDGMRLEDPDDYIEHRVALMGADGRLLTGFDYSGLSWLDNGSIAFEMPGEYPAPTGAMDPDGHVLVEPKYRTLKSLGEGCWLGIPMNDEPLCSLVLVDAQGRETDLGLHIAHEYLPESSGGVCAVCNVVEYGGKCALVDKNGATPLSQSYEWVDDLYGNYFAVSRDDSMGLMDRQGDVALPLEYEYLYHSFDDATGVYVAQRGAEMTLVNARTGEVVLQKDLGQEDFSVNLSTPGLAWVYVDGGMWCFRTDGTEVGFFPEPEGVNLQIIRCTPDALRIVRSEGEWPGQRTCLEDGEGNRLSADYHSISEGWRGIEGRYLTYNCKIVRDNDGEPRVAYYNGWRFGVIDQDGKELLPPVYLGVQVLSTDRYWVETFDRVGMIDSAGNWYYVLNNYEMLMD